MKERTCIFDLPQLKRYHAIPASRDVTEILLGVAHLSQRQVHKIAQHPEYHNTVMNEGQGGGGETKAKLCSDVHCVLQDDGK